MSKEHLRSYENEKPNSPETPVLDNLKLLDGSLAKDFILEKIDLFPSLRGIVIFGEAGNGKTAIASEIARQINALNIETQMTTYDSSSGRVVEELGREKPQWSDEDYDHLSDVLLKTFDEKNSHSRKGKRKIQILELVGVGKKNRGISTLQTLAERVRDEFTDMSTFFVGVVPDYRIQSEAGFERKNVEKLNPEKVIPFLEKRNLKVEGFKENLSEQDKGQLVKNFYKNMARAFQIEIVRKEVTDQAELYSQRDGERLFSLLIPQESIGGKKRSTKSAIDYRVKAAHLQLYLDELKLTTNPMQTSPHFLDKGVVVFNRYNGLLQRVLDLSIFKT